MSQKYIYRFFGRHSRAQEKSFFLKSRTSKFFLFFYYKTMPYKRTYRRRRRPKKRTYRRKPKMYKRIGTGFPLRKLVRSKYNATISLDAGVVANAFHCFSTNSIHDPDQTLGGHQPSLFDTMSYIYNKYTVLGSKITVRFMPNSAVSQTPALWSVSILKNLNDISGKQPSDIIEQGFSKSSLVRSTEGTGNSKNTIIRKWSAKKAFIDKGENIGTCNSGGSLGTGSTNPAKQNYFAIWASHVNSNDPSSFAFLVTIDYLVLYHDPKPQTQS